MYWMSVAVWQSHRVGPCFTRPTELRAEVRISFADPLREAVGSFCCPVLPEPLESLLLPGGSDRAF